MVKRRQLLGVQPYQEGVGRRTRIYHAMRVLSAGSKAIQGACTTWANRPGRESTGPLLCSYLWHYGPDDMSPQIPEHRLWCQSPPSGPGLVTYFYIRFS